jgi:CRISPR-associated protein Csm4
MAKFNIYKLHFTTPIHIGDNRDDYSISLKTVQSDAMYAAITACLAKLGESIPDDGDLGFTISSLFPFYQDKKADRSQEDTAVYFFPKPLKQKLPKLENVDNAKKIKKVSWIDKGYFERMLKGETLFERDEDIKDIKDAYLTGKTIDEKFISSQVTPRVTVSRTSREDAKPFYTDRVYFKGYSGLYFIADGNKTLIEKGLQLLQYEGIGTDRNVGNGCFVFESNCIEIDLPKEGDMAMSLSMFIPENKEQLETMIGNDCVAYDFTRRGGWITTPPFNTLRKNVIHAFVPASVFVKKSIGVQVLGKIVDLSNNVLGISHPIWRNGKSIFIPIKL